MFLSVDPRIKIGILLFLGTFFLLSQDVLMITKFIFFFLVFLMLNDVRVIKTYAVITLFSSFMVLLITSIFLHLDEKIIIIMIVRLNSFISLFMWYSHDLDPEDLSKTLIWFHVPFSFAMYVSSTFRYIFYFKKETETIIQSLKLRGIPLDSNFRSKLGNFHYVLPPLFYRIAVSSQNFKLALFNKNWSPYGDKTFLRPLKMEYKSNIVLLIVLIVLIYI